jgi:protein-tyrosine-phosphatase
MAHVLFVCLHNAGRSQMSAAFFEKMAQAGTKRGPPGPRPPPVCIPRSKR